jgi:quercetin dioxygenase-like cupin family protein
VRTVSVPDPEVVSTYYNLDPYADFLKTESVPIVEGYAIDCKTVSVEPWERVGGLGAYLHLTGRGWEATSYISEIPPGESLKPQQHMYDENVYVVSGRGATTIELPSGRKHTFEWGEGSGFGIPMNAKHQHFNGSGTEPARLASVTDLPLMMSIFHDVNFIFDNSTQLAKRFGEERYFQGEGEFRSVRAGRHQWETNFVPDLRTFELPEWHARGAGGNNINFIFADSTMHGHISEFPTGTYKKAHRHNAGAHIFLVTGRGYSLLWLDGEDPVATTKVDWYPGVLFAPPDGPTFHQHFNTSDVPARYLVYLFGNARYPMWTQRLNRDGGDVSVKQGGMQIEYEDEDPRILELFEKECARAGSRSQMREFLGRG